MKIMHKSKTRTQTKMRQRRRKGTHEGHLERNLVMEGMAILVHGVTLMDV